MSLGTDGNGPWQVTQTITEVNTLGLVFAGTPASYQNSVGYATGWANIASVENSGAQLYEYTTFSTQANYYPQSNLDIIGDNNLDITNAGNAMGLSVIADALVGDGNVPSDDPNYTGTFTNQDSNSNILSVGVGATDGCVLVVMVATETGNPTDNSQLGSGTPVHVTSVSGMASTWIKRKDFVDNRSNCGQAMEVWYAIVQTGYGGIEDYVTVTFDGQFDDGAIIVKGFSGVNLSQPFTTSGAFTSNDNGGTPGTNGPVTHVFDAQSGIEWMSYGDDGSGHGYLSVGYSNETQDPPSNPPVAGWYFIDDNNNIVQLRNDVLWFSGGQPSPYPNGAGWLCVADQLYTYSAANTSITFYETIPNITPSVPTITFTGGFTIVPNNFTIPSGSIDGYYLVNQYAPAVNQGWITLPSHDGGSGLDFNEVNPNTGNAIYINPLDINGTDNSTYLNQLVGNHTHLTFTQGNYHITYDCTALAWANTNYGGEIYHDPTYESAPRDSISIISTSGVAFNEVDPITISVEVQSVSFTINSSDFTNTYWGSNVTVNGTTGFTTGGNYGPGEEFVGLRLDPANGGNLTKLNELRALWAANGLVVNNNSYMFNVSWNTGSTTNSGVVVVGLYDYGDSQANLNIGVVDTTNNTWQTSYTGYYNGPITTIPGTWNFPATFTLIRPTIIDWQDWC